MLLASAHTTTYQYKVLVCVPKRPDLPATMTMTFSIWGNGIMAFQHWYWRVFLKVCLLCLGLPGFLLLSELISTQEGVIRHMLAQKTQECRVKGKKHTKLSLVWDDASLLFFLLNWYDTSSTCKVYMVIMWEKRTNSNTASFVRLSLCVSRCYSSGTRWRSKIVDCMFPIWIQPCILQTQNTLWPCLIWKLLDIACSPMHTTSNTHGKRIWISNRRSDFTQTHSEC